MLDIWLVPALIVVAAVLCVFYLFIKFAGGSGVRTHGRTIVDKPQDEENPPPG